MSPSIWIGRAENARDVAAVQDLFREFIFWVGRAHGVSVGYQDWAGEMTTFPDRYLVLLLAKVDDAPAAALALKHLSETDCELKRMYCRDAFRGLGLARRLCEMLMEEARARGYRTMRLDTHGELKAAIALYETLGFKPSAPHNEPGNENTLFFARPL
jgi:ribosomal protein S18 acetylase RimI-like enzyme